MKLYLVLARGSVGYDSYDGHVIAAQSPAEAVKYAKKIAADEGKEAWTVEDTELIATETNQKAGIVLSSFNAG